MPGAGLSALPDTGTAGLGSLPDPLGAATDILEARRQGQTGNTPGLGAQWDALMQAALGDSVVRRTIAARDALRRGDAQAAHEATMPVARDLASFVGNIAPVTRGLSALGAVDDIEAMRRRFNIDENGYLRLRMRRPLPGDIPPGADPHRFQVPELKISPDGGEVIWSGLGNELDAKQRLSRDLFSKDPYFGRGIWEPSYEGYWRGTANKREIELAKAGVLRPSRNVVDGTIEPGVSVSRHVGTIWADYPYGYRVNGELIGRGSDGEPVLAPRSIQPLTGLKTKKSIIAADQRRQKEIIEALGIPEEVYRAMASGKFFLEWSDR